MVQIKKIFFISLILILSLGDAVQIVKADTYQGNRLQEPLRLEFSIEPDTYRLFSASQRQGDFQLLLKDGETGDLILHVNGTALKGLDELMLVSAAECDKCRLELDGVGDIDRASPYRLSNRIVTPKQSDLALLHAITKANVKNQLASQSEGKQRSGYLTRMAAELDFAVSTQKPNIAEKEIRHSAMLWLAEAQFYVGDSDKQLKTLNRILEETSDIPSIYRSHALFDLAPLETNVVEERRFYQEGIQIAEQFDDHFVKALGLNYQGVTLVRASRFDEAIASLQEAFDIHEQKGGLRFLLGPLHNLSWANYRALNLPVAIASASRQKYLAEQYQEEESAIWALYNLALAYGRAGERYEAENFVDEALTRLVQLPSRQRGSLGSLKAYLIQERTERLLEYGVIDKAADSAFEMGQVYKKLGWPARAADAEFILGEVAFKANDLDIARGRFSNALEYDLKNNRTSSAGKRLLRLAALEINDGRLIEASRYQVRAFKEIAKTKEFNLLAHAFNQAIRLLHLLGDDDEGSSLAQRVKSFVSRFGGESDRIAFLYNAALVQSNSSVALALLDDARGLIDSILPRIARPSLRQSYLALQKQIFELNVKLLTEVSGDIDAALAVVEGFKARTLKEKIRQVNSDLGVEKTLLQKRADLLARISKKAVNRHAGKLEDSSFADRNLSAQLEKVEVDIARQRVDHQSLTFEMNSVLSAHTDQHELIAYYFTGQEQSWLWVLDGSGTELYPLPSRSKLARLSEAFLNAISTAPTDRNQDVAWAQVTAAQQLSAAITFPLTEHLRNNDISKLTIIPDGPLHSVPFSALFLSGSTSPIVTDYAVSYLPSISVRTDLVARDDARPDSSAWRALVVANPISSADSGINLSPLQYSENEAREIKRLLGESAVILSGELARKDRFLSAVAKPHKVLHFATHGLLNEHDPAQSGLVFSSEDSQNPLWLASEISAASLNAELVVLSACDSSTGKGTAGEGLFSLSRAFIESGVNQVVGSLWQVQDQQTAELMSEFYSGLFNDSLGTAQALRRAQLSIYTNQNNDWMDPYYWAGFVLHGEGQVN